MFTARTHFMHGQGEMYFGDGVGGGVRVFLLLSHPQNQYRTLVVFYNYSPSLSRSESRAKSAQGVFSAHTHTQDSDCMAVLSLSELMQVTQSSACDAASDRLSFVS